MESNTAYANYNDKPVYACPQCETTKKEELTPIKVRDKRTIDFKCACGACFAVSTEYTRCRRILISHEGTYTILSDSNKKRIMQVENLSIGGIGFTTRTLYALSVGDKIKLTFTLDDEKRSEVRKEATVKHIFSNYVGCEFTNRNQIDSNLTFYLMP